MAVAAMPEAELSLPMATLIGVRLVAGTALLIAPGRVLGDLPHREIKGAARAFARVLGARHLVEAAVLWRDHTHRWVLLGAGVDATHAATMLALAVVRPDERRLALTNAITAAALAGAGTMAARHDERR
jgi:hypothetical protein